MTSYVPDKLPPILPNERSAAKKLLQAKVHGLKAASVFEALCLKTHEELDLWTRDLLVDLHDVKHDMDALPKRMPWSADLGFEIILYHHELYEGFSLYHTEFSWMVWADRSLTRFLLVGRFSQEKCGIKNCGCLLSQDYNGLLELSAQRLLNLVSYLPLADGGPRWVPATFTSPHCPFPLDELFLHLTPSNTPPVLGENDLVALDCLIRRAGLSVPSSIVRSCVLRQKGKVELPKVMGHGRNAFVNDEVKRLCGTCGKKKSMDDLQRCGGCRMVFYCDPRCQRNGWKEHRGVCMSKEGRPVGKG
ncbi:SET and MYND domain-containing protein 3 [Rhodosporidiobolus nylandii]